jgi:hypothetical protein
MYVHRRIVGKGAGEAKWFCCPRQQSPRVSKVNTLNENKIDFLPSTVFTILRKITGNVINSCSFLCCNFCLGSHFDFWSQVPKKYLTTPLYVHILVLFKIQPLLVALITVIICSCYGFTLSLLMIWSPFTIPLLVSSFYENLAIIYIFCQYQPLPTICVFASSYILRPTTVL